MSSGSNKLIRVFGIAFGLAAVVGSVVGQGILRTPGVVAEATCSPVVIIAIWIAGAVVALISAFAFAELGASGKELECLQHLCCCLPSSGIFPC